MLTVLCAMSLFFVFIDAAESEHDGNNRTMITNLQKQIVMKSKMMDQKNTEIDALRATIRMKDIKLMELGRFSRRRHREFTAQIHDLHGLIEKIKCQITNRMEIIRELKTRMDTNDRGWRASVFGMCGQYERN